MIIHRMEQRSEEWHQIKLGKFSASDMATVANGRDDTRKKLAFSKAAELITGTWEETYINAKMQRGIELEPEARQLFEFEYGVHVEEVGFVEYDRFSGCSPDGLIGDDLGLELKAKDIHTHLQALVDGDDSHKWQLYGSMFFTGRDKWYLASYNPRFPAGKELAVSLWHQDEDIYKKIAYGLEICKEMLFDILRKAGFEHLITQ